jgi:hypothetical protein
MSIDIRGFQNRFFIGIKNRLIVRTPSLYLNIGKAHEDLGNRERAKRYYELAATKMSHLPEGRYADIVRDGIKRGLERVS